MIRILTKNGVDNTNVDGARDHNFNAGRRSGIVQGALNQGNFFASNNNTIALDTCELRLCGHRIVLDQAEYRTFTNKPSVPVRYSFVARVVVDSDDNVSFEFISQEATTQLVQDNLDITGSGTYELEIGKFTQLTDGNITDVVRTADLITGGADNDSDYIRIGTVTTNKISPELDADVDIENTINPTDNKPQTNFTFNLPTAVGTVVSVNGEEKTAINTDLTPTANSENLITSGGVHDYPAITFAENERQKSKNLFDLNYNGTFGSTTEISVSKHISLKSVYGEKFTINTNLPQYSFTRGNIGDIFTNIIFNNLKPSTSYTISFVPISVTTESTAVHFLGVYNVQDRLGTKVTRTITTDENGRFNTEYGIWISAQNTTFTVSNVQLEEGSVATDYQPYNGEFIQEKEFHETAIVRYGISLSDIANSYQSTWDELIKGNGFGNFYTSGDTFPSFLPACPDDIWHKAGNVVEIGVKIKSNNFTSSMEFVLQGVNQNNPAYKLDAYFDGTNWRNSGWYKPRAIELIYDKDTKNTIDGKPYTGGLYTSGLYIKNNIPNDVTRLRIYYLNQQVSILDHGGTKNICELDIRDRNTEWCETCVVNAHKSDADAVDDTLFKLLLAVDTAGYMNVKFFKNTTKIEDGTSYVYRIEGIR